MSILVLLLSLVLLVWFWQDTLAAREQAGRAALDACRHQALQLLDGTVVLKRTVLARRPGGLAFRRTFQFAYSPEGDSRRVGFVIMLGRRVESVGL